MQASPEISQIAAYRRDGYVLLPQLIAPIVCNGLLARMKADFARQGITMAKLEQAGPLLNRPASEIYGYHYVPFSAFHWGMTPMMEALLGEALLPSYCYFRLYREGDICRVHGDRYACEHSLSLTLAYSDGVGWPLEVAQHRIDTPHQRADAGFADEEEHSAALMVPGDAVFYQGVHHHHGRTTPNPNRWSAHLFLHWVAKDGPYADSAFDGQVPPDRIEF